MALDHFKGLYEGAEFRKLAHKIFQLNDQLINSIWNQNFILFLTPCEKGIEDMLKEADKNGDGQVNIDGFLSVMDP